MRKLYIFIFTMLLMVTTAAQAQTNGYNRLKNVATGHIANLEGGHTFALNATEEEAHSLAGTVAYMAFEDNIMTALRAQNADVVGALVPAIKAMIPEMMPEDQFYVLKDSMVSMASAAFSGAMATTLIGYINRYTYEDFITYVNEMDTNLYLEATDGGYYLYFNSPKFPLNAGVLNDYFVKKINSYLTAYRGTMQLMAEQYLVGKEELLPMVYNLISHFRFADRFYLAEQKDGNFGFANSTDFQEAGINDVWAFVPVDNDANYFGVEGQFQDADGKWYASFAADFPIRLADGMKAYLVDSDVDPGKSMIHRVLIEEDIIPSLTPMILELNGKDAAVNKLQLMEGDYKYSVGDNQLQLALSKRGFLLGKQLEEPDSHYYVLGIKDGHVALVATEETFLKPNEAYYWMDDTRKGANTSGYLVLGDDVSGISMATTSTFAHKQVYDLQGRRVANPTKGLYIIDGKKVVLR